MKELNAQNNKVSGENRYDDSECRSENKIFATFRLGLLSMAFVCVADVPDNEIFTQRKAIKINKCSRIVGFLVTNLPEIDFLSSYSPPPLTVRAAEQYSNEFAKGPKSKEAAVWRQECSLLLRFGICALALSFSLPPPPPLLLLSLCLAHRVESSGPEAGGRKGRGKTNLSIRGERACVQGVRREGAKGIDRPELRGITLENLSGRASESGFYSWRRRCRGRRTERWSAGDFWGARKREQPRYQ